MADAFCRVIGSCPVHVQGWLDTISSLSLTGFLGLRTCLRGRYAGLLASLRAPRWSPERNCVAMVSFKSFNWSRCAMHMRLMVPRTA